MEKKGKNQKIPLTPKQLRAAELYGAGMNQTETAREVGVTPRTMRNWVKQTEFRRRCDSHYQERRNQQAFKTTRIQDTVHELLLEIVKDQNVDVGARIRASKILLDDMPLLKAGKPIYGEDLVVDSNQSPPLTAFERGQKEAREEIEFMAGRSTPY